MNDHYSDESDETFYKERQQDLYNKIVDLHNSICSHEYQNIDLRERGLIHLIEETPIEWKEELKELIEKYEIQEGFNPLTGKEI